VDGEEYCTVRRLFTVDDVENYKHDVCMKL
jgi:hypothetical protein